ncbi:MAG TPA: hypothetical protein EYG38_15975, partial [Verrucomicrobia bacterium]|nr:hypothetical protein [Verrucomicrobiota bacterium]
AKVAYDGSTGAKKGNLFASFPGLDLLLTSEKAFSLTEEGIFALDREKNRLSEKELPTVGEQKAARSKEITSLRKEIKDLQTKIKRDGISSEDEATLGTLRKRLAEQTALLATLVKRETELKENRVDWKYDNVHLQSFILADQTLFASGNGIVVSVDSRTGRELAQREIDGEVLGMSAADGKLFLSTDRGEIFAFGKSDGSPLLEVKGLSAVKPRGHSTTTPRIEEPPTADSGSLELAAERILNSTGIEKGFCLVLDGREGRLAFEIARRSELKVVVLESDVTLRDQARKWLDDQGIYGRQIQVVSWELEELPDYFANLIVSEGMLREGKPGSYSPEEIYRVLRPFGGEAVFGVLNQVESVEGFSIEEWWKQSGATEKDTVADLSGQESWFKSWYQITRNQLIGSGSWKGLYGNAANTASTDDQLVKGPLGVLWFGEPGSEHMLERHSRTVGPLAVNGRLFVQGMELVQAYDGYNGTFLWERKIPGAVRVRVDVDGGNIYADDQSLFVAAYEKVFRLNAATGETIAEYEVPPTTDGRARRWAYISVVDGILFGSTAEPLKNQYGFVWNTMIENGAWKPESEIVEELRAAYVKMVTANPKPDAKAYQYFKRGGIHWRYMNKYPGWGPDHNPGPTDQTMIVSDSVFAFQVDSGKLIWQYDAPELPHISITIGDGNLYLIHGELSAEEKETATKERLQWIRDGVYFPHAEADLPVDKKDFRRLTALDAKSGETLWSQVMDVTGCGGNKLGSSYHDGKLLLFGHYSNHDQNVFVKGGLNWRRITVLAGSDGQCLWSKPLNYRRRPLVMGNRIYIEPRACSLDTGDIVMRDHPITGESVAWEFLRPGHSCGIVTAAPNGIFFRSYCAAIVNVEKDTGLQLFGAMRTGCWNNLLPANGVLNFQESSAGCSCSYALRSTVVLKHKKQKEPGEWSVFITHGAQTPVSHLAINLGAPGDMRDNEGTLWFGYPRPDTKIGQGEFKNYGLKFDIHETVLPGMGVFRRDFRGVNIEGSKRPWLYTSGLKGLKSCRIKLLDGQKPSAFKVRIGFVASKEDGERERYFSLKLQGRQVLKKFSVLRESGRHGKAVIKEFEGIQVIDDLHLEVIPAMANPSEKDAPMIHFIEIINQGDSNRTIAVN